jgi:hypothetical protein
MTRAVSVGRSSKGLFIIGALGSVLVTMTLTGCPGTLQGDFPPPSGGTAGASGGTAGAGTGGMAMGTAGAMGTGGAAAGCDVNPLFSGPTSKYKCSETQICHDAAGDGAGFNMATADWQTHLVGQVPKGGGQVASICAKDPAFKTVPYIIAKSPTGDGLLIQKLKAAICSPGGSQMPFAAATPGISADDMTCVQAWATALANK